MITTGGQASHVSGQLVCLLFGSVLIRRMRNQSKYDEKSSDLESPSEKSRRLILAIMFRFCWDELTVEMFIFIAWKVDSPENLFLRLNLLRIEKIHFLLTFYHSQQLIHGTSSQSSQMKKSDAFIPLKSLQSSRSQVTFDSRASEIISS
jgi:hypothetical protein